MGRDELVGVDVGLGHYAVTDVVHQKHAEEIEWSGIVAGIVASRCVRVWRQVASFSYVTFTTDLQSITILSFALLLSIITLSLSPLLLLTVWLSNISLKLIFTPLHSTSLVINNWTWDVPLCHNLIQAKKPFTRSLFSRSDARFGPERGRS